MTAIQLQDHAGQLRRHGAIDTLADATDRVVANVRAWRRRMRERHELAGLDDRMLQDIGLSRGEAEFLINKPFWRE